METHEKIRTMREFKQLTQEEMAEKLAITAGGYAKIERGESSINLTRLEQIAQILNINVSELLKNDTGFVIQLGGDNNHQTSFYATSSDLISEIEKLQLIIQHKDELLAQKDRELAAKDEIIALLRK
ncbi:helix-turn-helix domain-containing protein [Wielerella bovis]|uniref:helix-turn-helix domain-containing protein n=1 Tax=Wielerella bovis TaxID=2917790 RepID=UPI0020197332|nr:helix-turn-helix transcriptional regulator [Wielerella bovis]MCG7656991.1 helix-turn-helix domain-containing protein [Wielerella bovis]MCG7659214.1 helix-turn-helix domain-containing protein [Wielerella bovis]